MSSNTKDWVDQVIMNYYESHLRDELIDVFLSHAPEVIADLVCSVDIHNYTQMRFLAHRLKGEALFLGANRLAKVCGELEEIYECDEELLNNRMLFRLKEAFDGTQNQLLTLRGQP
ncbi:MAG: Hpt domain-containing protein [Acidobacteria bacterium]|nr:Hpt domain-containing protein [Acidobacteriota bacterium]